MNAPWPKPTELAILTVNGRSFQDWLTVSVTHRMRDSPAFLCKFTVSEGMPIASNVAKMQIKPGDVCTVTLAGVPAFKGKVVTRQVYIDANRHHIEIQCASNLEVNTSSVISQTMEWKDKKFDQIAREQLGRLGINLVFEGGAPPQQKFPRVSAMHGETIYDFLDNLARSLSQNGGNGIAFTSNVQGDFVVAMAALDGSDDITEGRNMIIGREIIYNPANANANPVISQAESNDKQWGAKNYSMPFFNGKNDDASFSPSSAPAVIVNEFPTADKQVLQGRATSESKWQDGDQITVVVTVHGWLKPSGGLWKRNQIYTVNAPSLMMNGERLCSKSVTFTQDNTTGTRTTLELCNDAAIGGTAPAIN